MKKKEKNTKIKTIAILLIIILVIAILGIIIIKSLKGNNKETISFEKSFSLTNIENPPFELKKSSKELVIDRYKDIFSPTEEKKAEEVSITKANVDFEGMEGKMIYARGGDKKANIFQYKIPAGSYNEFMTNTMDFDKICKKYLKLPEDKDADYKYLYGGNNVNEGEIINQSIYNNGLQYCKVYKITNEEKTEEYNVNYYIVKKQLILEFVKIVES